MAASDDFAFSTCFSLKKGYMYCEDVRIRTIQETLASLVDQPSPCIVYSENRIRENVGAYLEAVEKVDVPCMLGYAIKANYNPAVLSVMKDKGCAAITVSGNEVKLALRAGFSADHIVFNGNGKLLWEVQLAVQHGCIINVDSHYDLRHIAQEAKLQKKSVNVFLRVNPDIDSGVHDFIATGSGTSKFGVPRSEVDRVLDDIAAEPLLKLLGLHCHLGSTIDSIAVFSKCVDVMLAETTKATRGGRFPHLKYLNLGGGLGIDYAKHACEVGKLDVQLSDVERKGAARTTAPESRETRGIKIVPTPSDLMSTVGQRLIHSGLTLVLEPGRSLVGDVALLVTKVVGVKRNVNNYIVVDGAMTELIRPSLYTAYHHIELTEPSRSQVGHDVFNIVGPVCESTDFLGKKRYLRYPEEGAGVAIFDVGAYGACMASNYNMRCRPVEVMVNGNTWRIIKKPENLEDLLRPFDDLPKLP